MELIINISEKLRKRVLKENGALWHLRPDEEYDLVEAIKNGTPLPKGHGRLIDADALGKKLHRYTEAPYQYALTVFNDAPTIIEADKEEEE